MSFPVLVRVEGRSKTSTGVPLDLYRLDWSGFESLPEPYESLVTETHFPLDDKYVKGVVDNAERASSEWVRAGDKLYDTVIRESCMSPVAEYAACWSTLLSDFVDSGSDDFEAMMDKRAIIRHALLYKLWLGQTGRGLVWFHAKMDQLEDTSWRTHSKSVRDFVETMRHVDRKELGLGRKKGAKRAASNPVTSPSAFLFHVTYARHLDGIEEEGLQPGEGQTFTTYAEYARGKLFLTEWPGMNFWFWRYGDWANDKSDDPLGEGLHPRRAEGPQRGPHPRRRPARNGGRPRAGLLDDRRLRAR